MSNVHVSLMVCRKLHAGQRVGPFFSLETTNMDQRFVVQLNSPRLPVQLAWFLQKAELQDKITVLDILLTKNEHKNLSYVF